MTNQSVSAGTGPNGEVSGIRWWELRSPNSSPVIFQEGTYAPGLTDGIHRWMGSIAMNSLGDMALSYSASDGTTTFPSVYYTGRHAGDPPGQMTLGEGSVMNGTGSQTGSNRWGDYTSIDIDPLDDTTFWVVNEYVPTTSSIGWRLRIGAFNLAGASATGVRLRRLRHRRLRQRPPQPVRLQQRHRHNAPGDQERPSQVSERAW